MRSNRRFFLAGAILLILPLVFVSYATGGETKVRWDIVSVATGTARAGGLASALAQDGTQITITGSGTFELGDADEVTGGGNWSIGGTSGTYKVTRFIKFDQAPGTIPIPDGIGNAADAHAGLAFLGIRYSDGSRGILVVSCHLIGTPDSVFEGIRVSKGFVDFWNGVEPFDDRNRTLFHVTSERDDD